MTPKQYVKRRRSAAVCDRTGGGGWAIWMPSQYRYCGRISGVFRSPAAAWADAARRLK